MNIPTIPDLAAGQVAAAADLNNIAAAATFLLGRPMARIHDAAGGQTLGTTQAAAPAIHFAAEDFDTDNIHSPSLPTRLTVQTPGWYSVRYSIQVTNSGFIGNAIVTGTAGGNNPLGAGTVIGTALMGYCDAGPVSAPPPVYLGASGIYPAYLYAGDYLTVSAWGNNAPAATSATAGFPQSSFAIIFASA